MNQLLIKYQQTLNRLPLEARAIVLVVALGLVFITWYYGFWQSLQVDLTQANTSIKTLESTIAPLKIQLQNTRIAVQTKHEQILKTKQETTLNKGSTSSQLMAPQKICEVLQYLLTTRYRMTLLELSNIPPKEVILSSSNTKIFEHDLVIKFQGNYFATMNYLQAIEKLGWRIFWDKLEYKVVQYPMAEIILQIHTLSDQEDWINV